MPAKKPNQFGQLIRRWRRARNLSQLDISLAAEVSTRHLSFLENGRSRPSREMVLRLGDVLDVPLRERNALLVAAGYAGVYRETDLFDPALAGVRASIEFLLAQHEPFPAVLLDRGWNVQLQNRAAGAVLPRFVADPAVALAPPVNLMRLLFDRAGARCFLVNWDALAGAMIQRLHREAMAAAPGDAAHELLARALAAGDVPSDWRTPDLSHEMPVMLPLHLRRDDVELRLFSAITTMGTPHDVTLQELRMETYFPADADTEASLRRLVGDA